VTTDFLVARKFAGGNLFPGRGGQWQSFGGGFLYQQHTARRAHRIDRNGWECESHFVLERGFGRHGLQCKMPYTVGTPITQRWRL